MICVSEFFGDVVHKIAGKAYKWPRWARRAYVLTWPASVLVRFVVGAVFLTMFVVTAFVEFTIERLHGVWHGNKDIWK
jgi:hypothetical protein